MAAQVDQEKCTGCGICVDACPVNAIHLEDKKAKIDGEKCVECAQCESECPNKAIKIL